MGLLDFIKSLSQPTIYPKAADHIKQRITNYDG